MAETNYQALDDKTSQALLEFAQALVRIRSYPGAEGEAVQRAESEMRALGYDEVVVDGMGNLLGRIGDGNPAVMLDSHLDTVEVTDAAEWTVKPFGGAISNGRLCGRGSVDMKAAAAASIYGAALAARTGRLAGRSVYVSCSVMEEDCDGENLKHLFSELNLRPDAVVICEPSGNTIALGHKGKAQVLIRTHGVAAHGAAPEKGKNAVYEMAEIIRRVETLNERLRRGGDDAGSIVLSRIASTSASLNAVPTVCEIYLDRRLVLGEDEETVKAEMDALVSGTNATWEIGTLKRLSWTGMPVEYNPIHPPWRIDENAPLALACRRAYARTFGRNPENYTFWDFSTNAVTPVALGIPTIGFGPGDHRLAHMRDESCAISEIVRACEFYAALIGEA